MKTISTFIVFLLLLTGIIGKTAGENQSLNGTIGELPEEITEIKGVIGGWSNSAADDGNGNVFISVSNRILTAKLDSPVTVLSSVIVRDEAKSMTYDNGRLACCYFVFPAGNKTTVTTFQPGEDEEPEHYNLNALSDIYGISRIVLKNGYLYVAEMEERFLDMIAIHIFDWTSGPNNNDPIASYIPDNTVIYDFAVDNNLIYVAGDFNGTKKLVKVNTEDKGNPFKSFSKDITNISSVVFNDEYIFAGQYSDFGNDGLMVIRRSDYSVVFEEPIFSSYDVVEMIYKDSRIYARNNSTVTAINVSGLPGVGPQVIGQKAFNLNAQEMFLDLQGISNGKIYYTNDGKFGTIEVSNPGNMLLSGGLICPRVVVDQDISDHVMVVADDLGDVFTYRFDDPEETELVSTGNYPGVSQVFIKEDDNQCFLYEDFSTIKIVDLDNLGNPEGYYRFHTIGAQHIELAFGPECCFAAGAAFEIFSLHTNEGPDEYWPRVRYSSTPLEGTVLDIYKTENGNGLFVATSEGLSMFYVESISDPQFVNTFNLGGNVAGIRNDGDFTIICTTNEEGTWLSAYNDLSNSTYTTLLSEKLRVKQKIANVQAFSETFGNLVDMVDGLILVIVENSLLSFTFLPESNEFRAGATFDDTIPFQNIKAFRQNPMDKSTHLSSISEESPVIATMLRLTNGIKTTKAITQAAPTPTLTVSHSTLEIGDEGGGTAAFTITSNTSWTLSSDQSWLTVEPASGSDNGTITVTVEANTATTDRTATITVSGEGVTSQSIPLTQVAAAATVTIPATIPEIGAEGGGTATLTITSNTSWTLSSDQDWLSVNPVSGSGNQTITLIVAANTVPLDRTASISVSGDGAASQTITLTQAAAAATLSVSHSSIELGAGEGSTAIFTITSNTNWTVSTGQEWLEANPVSGTGTACINLIAGENVSNAQREATVSITSEGAGTSEIIVTQAAFSLTTDQTYSSLKVYPNPADAYIILNDLPKSTNQIRIYNVLGYLCLYKTVSERMIDIKELPSGSYILKTAYENKTFYARFLKR